MVLRPAAPFIAPGAERNLAIALGLSLLLHGFALWHERGAPAAGDPAPLRATLHKPSAALAPASGQAASEVAAPLADSLPEPVERTYERPPSPPASPATETATAPDQVPEEAPLLQPPSPAIDLDGLRQYHAALSRVAAHFHRYPEEARDAGWEGRAVMRLHISAAGMPIGLSLIDDTGFPVLDQAALEMMRLAAGHTAVPASLHGRAFTIDLAVDYKLGDKGR